MAPHIYLISTVLLIMAALVVFRFFVRRDYLEKKKLTPLSGLLEFLIFFTLGYLMYIDVIAGQLSSNTNLILITTGWILIIFGLGLMLITMTALGIRRTFGQEVTELKQSGFYNITRNPQIVTCALFMLGYALLWPSWRSLGFIILYMTITHIMVLTEEEHLKNVHGEKYKQYCDRVPRYNFIFGLLSRIRANSSVDS